MKFEIYKGRGKHPWYWRARASNGQITAQSEGYVSKRNAKRAVTSFIYSVLDAHLAERFVKNMIVEVD